MSQSGLNFDIRGNWMGGPALNRMNGDLRRARGNIDATSLAGKRFSEALGGSSWRRQVQQAGMQISDFSVQVAGGQSAILAFTQNAPQFIQNFGAMGGVMAAVVTIAGTVAFAMQKSGEAVMSFGDQVEKTSGLLEAYISLIKSNGGLRADIFEAREGSLKVTSETAKILYEIEKSKAFRSIDALSDSLVKSVESASFFKTEVEDIGNLLGQSFGAKIAAGMGGSLGRTIREFDSAMETLKSAANIDEILAGSLRLREQFASIVDVTGEMTSQQRQFWEELNVTIQKAELLGATVVTQGDMLREQLDRGKRAASKYWTRFAIFAQDAYKKAQVEQAELSRQIARGTSAANAFANTLDNEALAATIKTFEASKKLREELGDAAFEALRLASVDITSGVDAAAKAAANLAARLGVSYRMALAMGRMGIDSISREQAPVFDPRDPRYGSAENQNAIKLERIRQRMENVRDETSEIMDWSASIGSVTGSGGGGGGGSISDQVTEELTEVQEAFKRTEQSISQSMLGSFKSLLDGTKSLGESVRDILGSIVDKVIDLLMTPIFNNIAGGIAGGLGGLIGGLGGDLGIGSFEGGGFTGSGPRAGGLDGRGGRLAMVHPNESIYDHTRGQGGGGVTVNMTVVTQDAPSFQKSRRQIERGLASAMQRGAAA